MEMRIKYKTKQKKTDNVQSTEFMNFINQRTNRMEIGLKGEKNYNIWLI